MQIEPTSFPVLIVTTAYGQGVAVSSVVHTFKDRGEALDAMEQLRQHCSANDNFSTEAIALFRLY